MTVPLHQQQEHLQDEKEQDFTDIVAEGENTRQPVIDADGNINWDCPCLGNLLIFRLDIFQLDGILLDRLLNTIYHH